MTHMRFLIILFLCCCISSNTFAQFKTEQELVNEIVVNLQTGDDSLYAAHFPYMQLMMNAISSYAPKDSVQEKRLATLISNQDELQQFDPSINSTIIDMLQFVRKKGADSGVHWGDILIAKHELDKQLLPRELIGFELIAPLRMNGYIFIQDMLTRRRYCIPVKDIFLIGGKWYGGLVMNILEASNVAEYEEKLKLEERELQRLMIAKANGQLDSVMKVRDSVKKATTKTFDDDEDADSRLRDVAERKLYTGFFDKEIPVEIYVRGMKGPCPDAICGWQAMYRFGDIEEYILLDVELKADGTFVMTEEDVGVMELKLKGSTFTGTWTSSADNTEYEAYLKEKEEIKGRKLLKLDEDYEAMKYGR